jgi:hypothetical protein
MTPALFTTTVETFVSAACGFLGFCTPPNENAIAAFALKVPDVNATVNTLLSMEAVPAAPAGDVNLAEVSVAQLGEPESVTMSLAPDGSAAPGVNARDIVTPDWPAIMLDSEIEGDAAMVPLMMAGKVPVALVPRMTPLLFINAAFILALADMTPK